MTETFDFKHYLIRGEDEITIRVYYVYHHAEREDNTTPDFHEDIEIFDTVDCFHEHISLTVEETEDVIDAAWDHLKYEVQ